MFILLISLSDLIDHEQAQATRRSSHLYGTLLIVSPFDPVSSTGAICGGDCWQSCPLVIEGASLANSPMNRKTSSRRCHWPVCCTSHEWPHRWNTPPHSRPWHKNARASLGQSGE